MVIEAVTEAINELSYDDKGELNIHSDQSAQYTSHVYHSLLKANSIAASMSRPGRPIDNAPVESFFSTMKTEWIKNTKTLPMDDVIDLVNDYIDFYNYTRIRLVRQMAPFGRRKRYYDKV